MALILVCPTCRKPMDWSLDRVGDQPMLFTRCLPCTPAGGWEPIEIIVKPKGKAPNHITRPPD